MQLLLTLLCLISTTFSTPHEPGHQGHTEPKVAIDGYVNGYYKFLGHQFPIFFNKAHTAISGIETANHQSGIHLTDPHYPHSETSLLSNHQQADISEKSAAYAHQQENFKHNPVLESSGRDIEVFGHGHIHLNPIAKENIEEVFHIDHNNAGRVMETEKLSTLRNMESINSDHINVYPQTGLPYAKKLIGTDIIGMTPILGMPGPRAYPRSMYSQNNEETFGTREARYEDYLKLNQANFGDVNSDFNRNQFFSRNQYIGRNNFDALQMNSANQNSYQTSDNFKIQKTTEKRPIETFFGVTDQTVLNGIQSIVNRNTYSDGVSYTDSKVIDHKENYPNRNVYFGATGFDTDHGRTFNHKENQKDVPNHQSSGSLETSIKQENANQNLYISRNVYDGYTSTGLMNSEGANLPDRAVAAMETDNGGIEHDSSLCDLHNHYSFDPSRNVIGKAGQEKLSLNGDNIRKIFAEKKPHQTDGIREESIGVQTDYERRGQINTQIIDTDGADIGSSSPNVYSGERQVDFGRSRFLSQGIPNAFPEYETMGGSNMNQKVINHNPYIERVGSSIPSRIGLVKPSEAATTQEGMKIGAVVSFNPSRTVDQNQNRDNRVYGVDQMNSGRDTSDSLELNRGIIDQNQYIGETNYGVGQLVTREDKSSEPKISPYPSYGRIDEMGTSLGVNRLSIYQNQNQARYIFFPSNTANDQFPVHGLNNKYYPLLDPNGRFFQGGLYGRYPIQGTVTSQFPFWETNYPLENRPTDEYFPQFGPNGLYQTQYDSQGVPLRNGIDIQYPSQNGLNSPYYPQGNVNVRYPSQFGFNGKQHRQGQYPLQKGIGIQYPSQAGINVQYSLLYGQFPIEHGRYLNSMLKNQLPQSNQGLTPLSSRLKDGSDQDSFVENIEPEVEVTDKETPGTETQISDAKSELDNDQSGTEPKVVDETSGINKVTSETSEPQRKDDETPESENESLKFQTKETTQVGDSQTIKFTIRLPPKIITTKTTTNAEEQSGGDHVLDEQHTMETQQLEKKGIQIMIDSPSFGNDQGGGVSRELSMSPRLGIDKSSKPVACNIAKKGTPDSSGSTLGLGDETESGSNNGDNGLKEDSTVQIAEKISSGHYECGEIESDPIMQPNYEKNETDKIQMDAKDSGNYAAIRNENDDKMSLSADNEGKPNNPNGELLEVAITKDTNEITDEDASRVSTNNEGRESTHVLDIHYGETDGHTGGIDELKKRSDEHGEIHVPAGGFDGLSANNVVVYPSQGYGIQENVVEIPSKHNVDSTYGVGLNSILVPGNGGGLGVHIKYSGPNDYSTGNIDSMKDYEVRLKPSINFQSALNFGHSTGQHNHNRYGGFQITGDHSGNAQEVGGHHGHLRPILDLARHLL